jgi:N12 class adenine-specific DNA methylase
MAPCQFGMEYGCAAEAGVDLPAVLATTLSTIAPRHAGAYPTARILVANDTNFVREKRQRFPSRAATGN